MEVEAVLEAWNDVDTEAESEVSDEECEDDLVVQECVGNSSEKRRSPWIRPRLVAVVLLLELVAQDEIVLCMIGRKLATVRREALPLVMHVLQLFLCIEVWVLQPENEMHVCFSV